VTITTFGDGATTVGYVEAEKGADDLVELLDAAEPEIRDALARHGGILFRGFDVGSPERFDAVSTRFAPDRLDYVERSTPRSVVQSKIYTSTEYPADQEIPPHNENSYASRWPRWILFACQAEASSGGETPLVDSRAVLEGLDPEVRDAFEAEGVAYVRNYGLGIDLSWQEGFQTDDPETVEAYCREAGIEFEWLKGRERLRTRHVRPATMRHPELGEPVWFNQAHLFHPASLPEPLRTSLRSIFADEELPRTALYGDGGSIDDETIAHVHDVYRRHATDVPWRKGDVAVVDNMRLAHGRKPFEGERRVLVTMAEAVTAEACVA
jgi:alpha-ketoglutarate-dependent taurine dioxygenase